MPRHARIAPKEYVYHILTRGNNLQDVFKTEEDYKRYIDILQRYKECRSLDLFNLIFILDCYKVVEIMKGINLSYVQYYKNKHGHIVHFYKSILISKDDYLLACGSYVELNPVRARIVDDPKDYKWNSYNAYAYGKKEPTADEYPIYKNLSEDEGERRKKYREFVKGMIKKKGSMKGEMNRRAVYGSDNFIEEAAKEYIVEAVIKPKGRPKKKENEDK